MEGSGKYEVRWTFLNPSFDEAQQQPTSERVQPSSSFDVAPAFSSDSKIAQAYGDEQEVDQLMQVDASEGFEGVESPFAGVTVKIEPDDSAPFWESQSALQLDGSSTQATYNQHIAAPGSTYAAQAPSFSQTQAKAAQSISKLSASHVGSPMPLHHQTAAYHIGLLKLVARTSTLRSWAMNGCKDAGVEVPALLAHINEQTRGPGAEELYKRVVRVSDAYDAMWPRLTMNARSRPISDWSNPKDYTLLRSCEIEHQTQALAVWHDETYLKRTSSGSLDSSIAAPSADGRKAPAPAVVASNQGAAVIVPRFIHPMPVPPLSELAMPSVLAKPSSSSERSSATRSSSIMPPPNTAEKVAYFVTQSQFQHQSCQITQLQRHNEYQSHLIKQQMELLQQQAATVAKHEASLKTVKRQLASLQAKRS